MCLLILRFGIFDLKNRITEYDVTLRNSSFELLTRFVKFKILLRVSNSNVELLFSHFQFTSSKLKNKIFDFELLTRWVNFRFFTFQ